MMFRLVLKDSNKASERGEYTNSRKCAAVGSKYAPVQPFNEPLGHLGTQAEGQVLFASSAGGRGGSQAHWIR